MSRNFIIRELHAMRDLMALVELQKDVWGMHDHETTSPHTMKAATVTGGGVLGAEADGGLIGFCFGIAAKRGGDVWLWSHMTAVRPEFQNAGIGFALKQAQREWALANGYRVMAWTFDPMQAGNANFNLRRLGATARAYYVNHYGAMQDELNAGLASDRLEAQWHLDHPRVLALARGGQRQPRTAISETTKLVFLDDRGIPQLEQPAALDEARYAIEIPASIAVLKAENLQRAQAWQLHAREAITALLGAGYHAVDFVRDAGASWYVMERALPRASEAG